ncbi:MAG: ferrous iron transport protein A [Puniceicoccales bacterium]|nr:ferrous iron transport protein A [Puniceicoccales bacterium]
MKSQNIVTTTLPALSIGQTGRVVQLHTRRPVDQRLLALGLMPGMLVRLVRTAPLGDPIEVEFQNQNVSLRKAEAESVEVELLPATPPSSGA